MTLEQALIAFPIFVGLIVATVSHVKSSAERSDAFISMVCTVLFSVVVSYIVAIHFSELLAEPIDILKYFLAGSVVVSGLAFSLGSRLSLVRMFIILIVIAIALLIRLSEPNSTFEVFINNWFANYFPYKDVDPKRIALGVSIFTYLSLAILFYIRFENEKRKSVVLKRGSLGLDPAALEKVTVAIAGLISLVVAMLATGINLPTISVVSGLLVAGIGFAAKDLLVNIAAGVVLIWDKSFKIDDVISIEGGGYGWIDRLSLRHAVIRDRDEVSILIPYTKLLSGTIQNWTYDNGLVRLKVDIGVDYEERNYQRIKELLAKAARNASERVLDEPAPRVNLMAAGSSAVEFQIRFYINTPKQGIKNVMSDVLASVLETMHKENIKIPYQTLDINIQNLDKYMLTKK